jgi:hypothetical protein
LVHQRLTKEVLVVVLESWDKELAVLVEVVVLEMAVAVALVEQLVALMVAQVVLMVAVVVEASGINLEVAQLSVHQVALAQ